MADILSSHRAWNVARSALKQALRRDGSKGPIVRKAVRDVAKARAQVNAAIEAAREAKRICA